jgi:hypothetical protein
LFAAITFAFCDEPTVFFDASIKRSLRFSPATMSTTVVVLTAAASLCVAKILRKNDNLTQLVGTSTGIVAAVLMESVLFVHARERNISTRGVAGVGIVALSGWTFYYFKQQGSGSGRHERDAEAMDHVLEKDTGEKSGLLVPTRKRVVVCILILIAQVIAVTVFRQPVLQDLQWNETQSGAPSMPTSTPSENVTGPAPPVKTPTPVVDDLQEFFIPRNITPSTWGESHTDIRCPENWALDNALPGSSTFSNWDTAYINSGCRMYPIPTGGMLFHVYWSGPWRPFNQVLIEAFLATQRLEHGHRLVYWYEEGEPTPDVLSKFEKYSDYVEFRKFDAMTEAEGYCVTNMPEWNNVTYLEEHGMFVQTLSDIVRYFLLARYGGVWLDADTIPMRDLTPMLRVGPSASSASSHLPENVTAS